MTTGNKFGLPSLDGEIIAPRRDRAPGPMGAAVRETAASLGEATEERIEQRRQNAEDARAWRDANGEGLVLARVALERIAQDDLPRDRLDLAAVAESDEMEELKASIRARGQKEPVELYHSADGRLQVKKGWRRLTALGQLLAETGDRAAFGTVLARIERPGSGDRLGRYVDMVEENVIREDLSFAEMAQVAIAAAADPGTDGDDAEAMVNRLYGALHKMKRSYIRSFVTLMQALGPDLRFPREVARNLGVEVARRLKAGDGDMATLRQALAHSSSADDQARVLAGFAAGRGPAPAARPAALQLAVGGLRFSARGRECRLSADIDFAALPPARLERALKAFEAALREEVGNPRVTRL